MSGGALFGNTASRGASKNLVEFKAGKMTVKDKMVYPDTRKGLLYVYQSDDSLMHFCWKDRTTGVIEDVRSWFFALNSEKRQNCENLLRISVPKNCSSRSSPCILYYIEML